jgi:hypothetical protein
LIWVVLAITVAVAWLAFKEEPTYSKVYQQTRLDGSFSTTYSASFQGILDQVRVETEVRFSLGQVSPVDDLHSRLYHPELPENWQRAVYPNWVARGFKRTVARLMLVLATLGLADSVSRVLMNGHGVFHGLGATGIGFRQVLALAFASAVVCWLARLYRAQFQTQGYLDGYSDRHRLGMFERENSESSFGSERGSIRSRH